MRIGHYTLEEEIGRGGMGIVHRAVDTRLGRRVAIKVLPADATIDPDRRRRFIQEARAASALNHPTSSRSTTSVRKARPPSSPWSWWTYDHAPVNARVDAVDDSSPEWRKERVSFDAAYGRERVPAILFLPKNSKPPYQTIVYFPSALARMLPSSDYLDLRMFDFIVRSGRALLYPIYQGTFERRGGETPGTSGTRDMQVQWAKDLFRAVDYLETRPDIDRTRLGYFSVSMGAFFAPIPLSQEPRLKAAVLCSTGMRFNVAPEIQPANFAPRVKIPILIINGRDDFSSPPEVLERLLSLFGTPPGQKSIKLFPGGHVPQDMRNLVRETLDWFDKYLGPV